MKCTGLTMNVLSLPRVKQSSFLSRIIQWTLSYLNAPHFFCKPCCIILIPTPTSMEPADKKTVTTLARYME